MQSKIILPNEFLQIAEEDLKNGKNVKILADGASMYPFIHGGMDIAEVEPISPETSLCLWHVYMFKHHGNYKIHRLIGKERDKLIMAGDGNNKLCELVNREDVIGRLKIIHRLKGKTVDCSESGWLNKAKAWHKLRPFRKYLLAIVRRLYRFGIIRYQ